MSDEEFSTVPQPQESFDWLKTNFEIVRKSLLDRPQGRRGAFVIGDDALHATSFVAKQRIQRA